MVRRYGRALRGERLVCKVPFGRWETMTFIAALRHDRITAPLLLDGPMKDRKLKGVFCDELTFATWRKEHPDGRVLRPDEKVASHYEVANWETQYQNLGVVTPVDPADALKPRTLSNPQPLSNLEQCIMATKWIQKAIRHPGKLHRALGVPQGKKIPAKKLASAAKKPGKLGQRARLAETLKGMKK